MFSLEKYFSWAKVLLDHQVLLGGEIDRLNEAFQLSETRQPAAVQSVSVLLEARSMHQAALLVTEVLYLFQGKMKEIVESTSDQISDQFELLIADDINPALASLSSELGLIDRLVLGERIYLRAVAMLRLNQLPSLTPKKSSVWEMILRTDLATEFKHLEARCHVQMGFADLHRCSFQEAQNKAQRALLLPVHLDQYTQTLIRNLQFTCAIHLNQRSLALETLKGLARSGIATPSQRLANTNRRISFHLAFEQLSEANAEVIEWERLGLSKKSFSSISYALFLKHKMEIWLAQDQVNPARETIYLLLEHLKENRLGEGFLELFVENAALLFLEQKYEECAATSAASLKRAKEVRNPLLQVQATLSLALCEPRMSESVTILQLITKVDVIAQKENFVRLRFLASLIGLSLRKKALYQLKGQLSELKAFCLLHRMKEFAALVQFLESLKLRSELDIHLLRVLPAYCSELSFFSRFFVKAAVPEAGGFQAVEHFSGKVKKISLGSYLFEADNAACIFFSRSAKTLWKLEHIDGKLVSFDVLLTENQLLLFVQLLDSGMDGASLEAMHRYVNESVYSESRHAAALLTSVTRLRERLKILDLVIIRRLGQFYLDCENKKLFIISDKPLVARSLSQKQQERPKPSLERILGLFVEEMQFISTSQIVSALNLARQNVHRSLRVGVENGTLRKVLGGKQSGYILIQKPRQVKDTEQNQV